MDTKEASLILEQASYSVIKYQGSAFPEAYKNLIFSKWLRSLRFGNDYFKLIDSDAYYQVYNKFIQVLLDRPNTVVRFAVLTDDKDVCLGFSVSEGSALHYVHVHKDYRNTRKDEPQLKIGTALLPKDFKYITHVTKTGLSIWTNKYPQVLFNPFI